MFAFDFGEEETSKAIAAWNRRAPQPVAREPLSRERVRDLMIGAGYDGASAQERADFINGLRHAEHAHGITGDSNE